MQSLVDIPTALRRVSLAALAAALTAGCAAVAPVPSGEDERISVSSTHEALADPAEPQTAPIAPETGLDAAPRTAPAPRATGSAPAKGSPRHEIVVLYSSADAGGADVAARIVAALSNGGAADGHPAATRAASAPGERMHVRRVDIDAATDTGVAAASNAAVASAPDAAAPDAAAPDAAAPDAGLGAHLTPVAIGRDAFAFARRHFAAQPTVFCQIYDYEALLEAGAGDDPTVWGVSPMPPLTLQLRGWKGVDASLERIGLIVGDGHERLLDDAARAAAASRIELTALVSSSDRETLYLFKRLAPELDGLWLFPDNRILSPAVLEELLAYAVSHGVGVLVHSEALLSWGALLSATSRPDDVAAAAAALAARVAAGATQGLPAMTALSQAAFVFNTETGERLGLAAGLERAWVLREPD